MFLCAAAAAQAQADAYAEATPAAANNTGTPAARKPVPGRKEVIYVTPANQWSLIELKSSGDVAYFENIEGLSHLKVFVTSNEGKALMDVKITAKANGVNFKKFGKGLYFLTLVNEATDEKRAFVFNKE